MKNPFGAIDKRLLENRPVLWISSIHWILGFGCLIALLSIFLGLYGRPALDLSGVFLALLIVWMIVILIWIIFQFRNYEKVFSTKQTAFIYLLNFIGYSFVGASVIIIFFLYKSRLGDVRNDEGFSRELLAVRIASLRNSDITFIKQYPQLFTSKGTDQNYDTAKTVDLNKEYLDIPRERLNDNPFIEGNLSGYSYLSVVTALRKAEGYKFVDSLLTAREKTGQNYYPELNEGPLFYKYLTNLKDDQLDSIRKLKTELWKKYGLTTVNTDTAYQGMQKYYRELQGEIRNLKANAGIAWDSLGVLLIIMLAIFSVSFNYIISKKALSLLAPFIYIALFALIASILHDDFIEANRHYELKINLILFLIIFIITRFRKWIGSGVRFFAMQLLNISALFFPILALAEASEWDDRRGDFMFNLPVVAVAILSVIVFLVLHYLFIRTIRSTLVG